MDGVKQQILRRQSTSTRNCRTAPENRRNATGLLAMTLATTNILEFDQPTLSEVTRWYKDFISPDLARLLRITGFGAMEVEGSGSYVVDQSGRRYLDFSGGYGVFSLGHRHPKVIEAVKDQLDKLALSSRVFFNPIQAKLAAKLAEISPGRLSRCFFSNSGTEAVEAALKVARLSTGRTGFVSTEGSYHGKTLGSLSVSGREKYKQPFQPLVEGSQIVPFGDLQALDLALTSEVAAFIVEPIQGEGGIHVASPDYLQKSKTMCSQRGILFIADEVQTGLGRTGTMFAVEQSGIEPDIMVLAKALGGGVMPIGATLMTPEVAQAYKGRPLLHTSTFGGSPLACRAALAALDVLQEEELATSARDSGQYLIEELQKIVDKFPRLLTAVRGRGLMVGLEFTEDQYGGSIIFEMVKRNVIAVYTLNQPKVIRFEPPLNVEKQDIEIVLTSLRESLEQTMLRLEKSEN